jgi:hypothetical protein
MQLIDKPGERVGAGHVRCFRGDELAAELRDRLVPAPRTTAYDFKDGILEILSLFARPSGARFFTLGLGRPFSFPFLRGQPASELVFWDYQAATLEQEEQTAVVLARF